MRARSKRIGALALYAALAAGAAWGGALGETVEARRGEEPVRAPLGGAQGVDAASCSDLSSQSFEGFCPETKGPKRKEPWTPVIVVPERPDDRPCDALNFFFEDVRRLECPGLGAEPAIRLDGPTAGGRAFVEPAPLAGDEGGGILPTFRICYRWEDMPEEIVVRYPWDDVYVGSGRVTISCCDDC